MTENYKQISVQTNTVFILKTALLINTITLTMIETTNVGQSCDFLFLFFSAKYN